MNKVPLDIQLITHRYIHRSLFNNVLHELILNTVDIKKFDHIFVDNIFFDILKCNQCKIAWTWAPYGCTEGPCFKCYDTNRY